jgi:hypothetical protein
MLLEVMLEFLGRHIDTICHLLVVGIVLLSSGKDFTQVIYRPLHRFAFFLLLHYHYCTDNSVGCRYIEQHRLLR